MGILITLAMLATTNLFSAQRKPVLTGTVDQMVTDLRQQQTKAMVGDTGGAATKEDYGIYFDQNQYVLFRGLVYAPGDSFNMPILLPTSFRFTNVSFPGRTVIFGKGSGEFINFSAGNNTVTVQNTQNNEQKTFYLNRFGTVYAVN